MRTLSLATCTIISSLLLLAPTHVLADEGLEEEAEGPSAEVETDRPLPRRPSKLFTASLMMDFWFPRDQTIIDNYGDQGQLGWGFQLGVIPWSKYVHTEISFGVGHRVKNNPPLAVLGSSSTSGTTEGTEATSLNSVALLSWPLQLDLMVGIDIADEQPIMPYGRIGLDMLAWTSRTTDENIKGMRGGWHWAAGIAFLLDVLAPRRAAGSEARNGIDDAYLTFEYREANLNNFGNLPEEERLDFGGRYFRTSLHLVF